MTGTEKHLEHHVFLFLFSFLLLYSTEDTQIRVDQAGEERVQEDVITAFLYSKGAYKKDGKKLFCWSCCSSREGNSFILKESQFGIRKKFFMIRVMKHWNRLPRVVVDDPPLETFKVKLDRALSNLILLKMSRLIAQYQMSVTLLILKAPSNIL